MGFPSVPGGPVPGPGAPPPGGPPVGPPPVGPPPGPYAPPPGGGGGSWFEQNKNWFLPVAGVVLVLALVAGFLAFSGDEAGADEIFLEPVDFEGEDPFTDPVTTSDASEVTGAVVDTGAEVEGSVNGSEAGLYGGSLNYAVCDREQLVGFLGDNADKARAFAGVLGIDVADIPAYIASLTAVILRGDTRVTNHGFSNGRATSLQSVLQAGTAVLVDAQGIPRVKCYCGNPLTPPVEVPSPRYGGDPWSWWDPARIQVIFIDIDINIFVLTDVINGGRFRRPPGSDGGLDRPGDTGDDLPPDDTVVPDTILPPDDTVVPPSTDVPLGTGDVQATLSWSTGDDLDLHVIDPSGSEIYFGARTSPSGGQLDHDDTAGCDSGGGSHVENVFWPTGGAPSGEYQAFVESFNGCGAGAGFTLEVKVGGQVVDSISGSLADGETSESIAFTVS